MSDYQEETNNTEKTTKDMWADLGEQFRQLGNSLGEAIRTTWNDPRSQETLSEIKAGLSGVVDEIDQAIDSAANSEEGKRIQEEARKTFNQLEETGRETVEKAKPHVLSAMLTVSEELGKVIDKLDESLKRKSEATRADEDEAEEA